MSARAWHRRRTKQGLAARQFAAIRRQMRRAKNDPLPQTFTSRGTGLLVTVTIAPKGSWFDEGVRDEFWDDEPEWDGHRYDPALGPDQARWVP